MTQPYGRLNGSAQRRAGPPDGDRAQPDMTSDSNLPRRYTEDQVSEILKHATDLQAEESTPGRGSAEGMTLAEIQEIAAEVGIDPRHLQTAAARLDRPEPSGLGVALAGGPLLVSVERVVPGEMSEDDFARIVPDIQQASTGHGNATMVGSTLTYSAETGQKQRTLQVVVSSQDGQTLIRAEERLHGLAAALFGGIVGRCRNRAWEWGSESPSGWRRWGPCSSPGLSPWP